METHANYALIGAVILFTLFALMGLVMWMGQVQFNREFAEYDVVFDGPVNGLSDGAAVRYLGLKVGEVEALRIDPKDDARVIARIRVDTQTPVRTDSTAILDFLGLTGATFIQIQAGTADQPLVRRRSGEPVPVIRTEPTQLASLVTGGQQIMTEASTTLRRLNQVMSDDNMESLGRTLANVERLTDALADEDGLMSDVRATLGRVDAAVVALDEAARSIETLASESTGEVKAVGAQLQTTLTSLEGDVTTLRVALERASDRFSTAVEAVEQPAVDLLGDVSRLGQDMQMLVGRLDRLTREIEQNPRGFVLGDNLPTRE